MSRNCNHLTSLPIVVNIFFAIASPHVVIAQENTPVTQEITGTIQITADTPQAIRTLLDTSTAIPGSFETWGVSFALTLLFGALGGIVFELLRLRGSIVLPAMLTPEQLQKNSVFYEQDGYITPNKAYDLGILARIFVGAMAALAVLLVISPATPIKLFATAVVAGSAGASIFDTLRARLQASLAIADAATVRAQGEEVDKKLEAMKPLIETLESSLIHQSSLDEGMEESFSDGTVDGDNAHVELLNDLTRLWGEAKGASESIQHISEPSKLLRN